MPRRGTPAKFRDSHIATGTDLPMTGRSRQSSGHSEAERGPSILVKQSYDGILGQYILVLGDLQDRVGARPAVHGYGAVGAGPEISSAATAAASSPCRGLSAPVQPRSSSNLSRRSGS